MEGVELCFVAIGENGLPDGTTAGEGAKGVEKDGLSGEWGEDLVGDGSVHACAVAGGEEEEPVHISRVLRGWHGRRLRGLQL